MFNPTELKNIAEQLCDLANQKLPDLKEKFYEFDIVNKWQIVNGEKVMIKINTFNTSVSFTVMSLIKDPLFLLLKENIENSYNNFEGTYNYQSISFSAGHYTQPQTVAEIILVDSFRKETESFSSEHFIENYHKLMGLLSGDPHEFRVSGRLQGVQLAVDKIVLDDEVYLKKLSIDEINERQPLGVFRWMTDIPIQLDLSGFNTEVIVMSLKEINNFENNSYFNLTSIFSEYARERINLVLQIFKLYKAGSFIIDSRVESYPLINERERSSLNKTYINPYNLLAINSDDEVKLQEIYKILKNIIPNDKVLSRSSSRFFIAVDEDSPEEELVDLVIALESILQTVNGNPIKEELRYRFSINGASLISIIDSTNDFFEIMEIMRTAYDCRSVIVHGGDSESLTKNLNKLNVKLHNNIQNRKFKNLKELNILIADWYRNMILWLTNIDHKKRPYFAEYGWEKLMRKEY
jgi:hypothetical protein